MKKLIFKKENKKWKMLQKHGRKHTKLFFKEIIWTQEDRPSASTRSSSLMELFFHMSSHVRDVIVNVLFEPDLTLRSVRERLRLFFLHIGLVTLEHFGLWLEISTSVNLSKADSKFGIRLSRMAMQDRLLFSCFFSHVFEIAQPDFTRKDVIC